MDKRIAVIRVRGTVHVKADIESTLKMLGLKKVNNAVIIDDRPSYRGMLQKIKDYVTWGEVDAEDVALILKNRGEVDGIGALTDEHIKKHTAHKSIDDFAQAFAEFKAELSQIPGLKIPFRLHPPRKGHKGIKRSYAVGGSLGNRGADIKELVHKMR